MGRTTENDTRGAGIMGHEECAEVTVDMWCLVNAKLIARKQTMLDPVVQAQILSESMKLYMTKIINEAKHPTSTEHHEERADGPSDKQMALISKMGGDARDISTRKEASEWIEKHKDW